MWLLLYFLKKIVVEKANLNKEHFKEQIGEMKKESDLLDHWTELYVCHLSVLAQEEELGLDTGAPNESIVQNHLNIAC